MNFPAISIGTLSKEIIATNDVRRFVVAMPRVPRVVIVKLSAAGTTAVRVAILSANLSVNSHVSNTMPKIQQ